ncbi:MAG: tetratricopeptide repeat protein, partial [Desulfobacteraceae bacterium]
ALRQAIELQPDHLDAILLLARIHLGRSRWADAADLLNKVLELDPGNEEAHELRKVLAFRQHVQYEEADDTDSVPQQ